MNQPMLTREEGEQVYSFEGKHVVQLHSESGNYREWLVGVLHAEYCIVQEGETWTVMYYDRAMPQWRDEAMDVEMFLATHNLILAT